VLLFVFLCAGVGVLLVILPWTDQWTDNYLLLQHPQLRSLVSSGFARGICSGLGLLDIWIGFWKPSTTTKRNPRRKCRKRRPETSSEIPI
jgi:hypothetical protein